MTLHAALRFWRTAKHLRWEQIVYRILARVRRGNTSVTVPDYTLNRTDQIWPLPMTRAGGSYLGSGRFKFLHVEGAIDETGNWNVPGNDTLWHYNLHYFDDLNAHSTVSVDEQRQLIENWVMANPPGTPIAWDPYPISIRIVNWIKWSLRGGSLSDNATRSLHAQADWLSHNLEHHLLANHLFENLKALLFASAYFHGLAAEKWRVLSTKLFVRELSEQILADGGHFERSPMYHLIVLEGLLDVFALRKCYSLPADFVPGLETKIKTMGRWAEVMRHPDGGIPLFNDSALNVAPRFDALMPLFQESLLIPSQTSGCVHCKESGFVAYKQGGQSIFVDIGSVAPSYQPAHAHAGTLSFEMSWQGERLFVNGGTSIYHDSKIRQRERGTKLHNTVVVDNLDSSEVWSTFRVGRRAKVYDVEVKGDERSLYVRALHDGYRWRPGRPVHERVLNFDGERLILRDSVKGDGGHDVDLHLHVAPGHELLPAAGSCWIVSRRGRKIADIGFGVPTGMPHFVEEDEYMYGPEFGLRVPARKLILRIPKAGLPLTFETTVNMSRQ